MGKRSLAPGYVLRPPESPDDWSAYHEIRRRAIFEAYFPQVAYQFDHPDEGKEGNFPLVLVEDDTVVGTVRIDLFDAVRAALRLVAIVPEQQRKGHGTALLRLAEDFARRHGRQCICCIAIRPRLASTCSTAMSRPLGRTIRLWAIQSTLRKISKSSMGFGGSL